MNLNANTIIASVVATTISLWVYDKFVKDAVA
jgi:hypothetical protein